MAAPPKVTYETFTAGEQDARAFGAALELMRGRLGEQHPFYIDGGAQSGDGGAQEHSPGDTRVVVGRFATASIEDFDRAVAVARRFAAEWAATDWRERVRIVGGVSAAIAARRHELAAKLAYEI